MFRPGLTRIPGDPFPEPIRLSVGLTVTGLSGNKSKYPYFSATTRISCHCSSPCFYLSSCDPNGFKCLKSISAETNMIASTRYSLHSSSMLFTKSGSFWVIVDGSFLIPSLQGTGHESFFSSSSSRMKRFKNITNIHLINK